MQNTPSPAPDNEPAAPPERRTPRVSVFWLSATLVLAALTVCTLRLPSQRPDSVHAPVAARHDAQRPEIPRRPRGDRRITGSVLDERGEPIAEAVVRLSVLGSPDLPSWEAVVASDGQFTFEALPAEPLRVEVSAIAHEAIERVLPAAESAPLVLTVARQGELAVRVVGCAADTTNARVYLSGGGLFPAAERPLDSAFESVFLGLPEGAYSVRARCGAQSVLSDTDIPVVPGARARVLLTVSAGARVRVRVVDAQTAAALPGAVVEVTDLSPGMPAIRADTDSDGRVEILGLWPGSVAVSVSHARYVAVRDELELPTESAAWREVRVPGAASIRGRVVDERGLPIAGATLSLAAADGQPADLGPRMPSSSQGLGELGVTVGPVPDIPLSAGSHGVLGTWAGTSDAEGAFSIEGLVPGALVVRASRSGFAPASQAVPDLAPHQSRALTLVLRAASAIRGRVHDASGTAVAGVYIAAHGADGLALSALSDEHGDFRFDDVLGAFVVEAEVNGGTALRCTVDAKPGAEATCDFESAALGRGREVRVVDALGFAVSGAVVTVVLPSGREVGSAITERDGSASLRHVPESPYRVRALAPGLASVERDADSDDGEVLRIVLPKAGGVTGVVLDVAGRGVPNAHIRATDALARSVSERDGSFRLDGLGTGVVVLHAEHESAGSGSSAPLRVRAGENLPGARIVLSGRYLADAPDTPATAARSADELSLSLRGAQVVVTHVRAGTAFARAGLRVGDVIVSVDGERTLSAAHTLGMLRAPVGKSVALRVLRGGRPTSLRLARVDHGR